MHSPLDPCYAYTMVQQRLETLRNEAALERDARRRARKSGRLRLLTVRRTLGRALIGVGQALVREPAS